MARTCALIIAVSLAIAAAAQADPVPPLVGGELVRAHHKKVAGAALIGIGSALAVAGQVLLIDATVNAQQHVGSLAHCGPAGCAAASFYVPEGIPGALLVGVGGALLLSGIPVYVVGGAQQRRAERPTLSFAPQLGPNGASFSARLRF